MFLANKDNESKEEMASNECAKASSGGTAWCSVILRTNVLRPQNRL